MKRLFSFIIVFSLIFLADVNAFASGTQKLSSTVFDPNTTYKPEDIVVLDEGWQFTDDTEEEFHNAGKYQLKATNGTDFDSWKFIIKQKEILPPELLINDVTYDPEKHYTLFTLYKVYDWDGTRFWGDISPQSYKDPGEYNIYVIADSNYYFKDKPSRYTDVFVIKPASTPSPQPAPTPSASPANHPTEQPAAVDSTDISPSPIVTPLPENYVKERPSNAPWIAVAGLCAAGACAAVYFLRKKN